MPQNWLMLTLVGKDQPGIVAKITSCLYESGCNLGEASMTRLGGNFTIMMMVKFDGTPEALESTVGPIADSLELRCHVDLIEGNLHRHVEPNVQVSVYGADRAGIVCEVTGTLAEAGLNILNLESDVGGSEENPIYIMRIEGVTSQEIEKLEDALAVLAREKNVETRISPIDVMMG